MACREQAMEHGFFGLNLASTGCGKTSPTAVSCMRWPIRNAGARFSIAPRPAQLDPANRAGLPRAARPGRRRPRYPGRRQRRPRTVRKAAGAPGAAVASQPRSCWRKNSHVHFAGTLEDGPLREWLGRNSAGNRLLQAPILACTIDHLMPASESLRGGHQIAPLLRLMTSDLVLDEVDDFDIDDLPALSRLVHWAGLFGSRVALPPRPCRRPWCRACSRPIAAAGKSSSAIVALPDALRKSRCAWFDEFSSQSSAHGAVTSFSEAHATFVAQRLAKLEQLPPRRQAQLCTVHAAGEARPALCRELAGQMNTWMADLHRCHHTEHQGRRISFGLLRLANIEPLIELAQAILAQGAPEGLHVHLCSTIRGIPFWSARPSSDNSMNC